MIEAPHAGSSCAARARAARLRGSGGAWETPTRSRSSSLTITPWCDRASGCCSNRRVSTSSPRPATPSRRFGASWVQADGPRPRPQHAGGHELARGDPAGQRAVAWYLCRGADHAGGPVVRAGHAAGRRAWLRAEGLREHRLSRRYSVPRRARRTSRLGWARPLRPRRQRRPGPRTTSRRVSSRSSASSRSATRTRRSAGSCSSRSGRSSPIARTSSRSSAARRAPSSCGTHSITVCWTTEPGRPASPGSTRAPWSPDPARTRCRAARRRDGCARACR